jgi:hypothetical protein
MGPAQAMWLAIAITVASVPFLLYLLYLLGRRDEQRIRRRARPTCARFC